MTTTTTTQADRLAKIIDRALGYNTTYNACGDPVQTAQGIIGGAKLTYRLDVLTGSERFEVQTGMSVDVFETAGAALAAVIS